MSDYNDGLLPEPCLRLDYGFGQQYASVELGDGTGYVRVTDDLRGEYHKMERWYDDELRAALDENAKLRELAADLLKGFDCGWPSDVCGNCERDSEGIPTHGCPLRNRARELGVEVD